MVIEGAYSEKQNEHEDLVSSSSEDKDTNHHVVSDENNFDGDAPLDGISEEEQTYSDFQTKELKIREEGKKSTP